MTDELDGIAARVAYVALALATILLGLTLHLYGEALGPTTRDVVGDILKN